MQAACTRIAAVLLLLLLLTTKTAAYKSDGGGLDNAFMNKESGRKNVTDAR